MNTNETVTIDIVSDVVFPWCYPGKSNLKNALQDYNHSIIICWHPFQRDPTIPRQRLDRKAYMAKKFPDPSYLKNAHERLTSIGTSNGLKFYFKAIEKSPNTLSAHRLIQWAGEIGKQDKIVNALFKANFEEGRDIGDRAALIEIAPLHGFEKSDSERKLGDDDDIKSVQAEIEEAQRLCISDVPFFNFNRKFAASGAQSPDQLLVTIKHAQA